MDWNLITQSLDEQGFAHIPTVFSEEDCKLFREMYDGHELFRKTVVMERHSFGKGEYKYFTHPLPSSIGQLRTNLYDKLVPTANHWMQKLGIDKQFPAIHADLLQQCQDNDQYQATPLLLKYGEGGYNTLHQDLYGDIYFPFQAVVLLTQPGTDFEGGEFVLTEQKIRAQSKAIVLSPQQGDMIIFTTNFRPVRGKSGYFRARMRHGVSEVKQGLRMTLGIIFHDAKT
jgi:hypothetical protein